MEVNAVELLVPDRGGFDSVANERDLARELAGAARAERGPQAIGNPFDPVPGGEGDADLDGEWLTIRIAERGLQAGGAELLLDPVRGAANPGAAEPAALHGIGRERIDGVPEARDLLGRGSGLRPCPERGIGRERERAGEQNREAEAAHGDHGAIVPGATPGRKDRTPNAGD